MGGGLLLDMMKKIIAFLFILQMLTLTFYGLVYLRSLNYFELLTEGNTSIRLNFNGELEDFHFFLTLADEKGLIASRAVFPDNETLILYTTNPTLDGRISLIEGDFPARGTSEFISTVRTDNENQTGLIANIVPGHEIIIADIHNPRNFVLDGLYDINTTDPILVEVFINELSERLFLVEWDGIQERTPFNQLLTVFFVLGFQEGHFLQLQLMEFGIIFSIITLCLFASVIQYVLNYLKSGAIYLSLGYSKSKIITHLSRRLLKTFLVAALIAYALSVGYLFYGHRTVFLNGITHLFLLFSIVLILIYLSLGICIALLALLNFKVTTVLKGQRFDGKIQIFNHLTKGIFSVIFLAVFSVSFVNFRDLNERLHALTHWEQARNVHRITVSSAVGLDAMESSELSKVNFYHDLVTYHQGFLMGSEYVYHGDWRRLEGWTPPPGLGDWEASLFDGSNEIFINPSFLDLNPIYDVNGRLASERLIFNDYVLNLLVPISLLTHEDEINRLFLDGFRSWRDVHRVQVTEIVPRELNLIWVADDQYYFSFDNRLRPHEGNRIKDPIVYVLQGRFSDDSISAYLTTSVYFHATTTDPFGEIEPLIHKHGLQAEIQAIESIYSLNAREIQNLRDHQNRLFMLMLMLLIANIAVSFNLIANYFERFKFQIFLKSTFGWGDFKTNQAFFSLYFSYISILLIISSLWLGGYVFLIGLLLMLLDVITMRCFQKRLLKKSFSEIMKGER